MNSRNATFKSLEEHINAAYDELYQGGAMNPTLQILHNDAADPFHLRIVFASLVEKNTAAFRARYPGESASRVRRAAELLAEIACARSWAETNPEALYMPMKG